MNQQEFMRKNLVNAMVSSGHKQAIAEQLADEGVRYWLETAKFKRSAWEDTLSYVKKRAKASK